MWTSSSEEHSASPCLLGVSVCSPPASNQWSELLSREVLRSPQLRASSFALCPSGPALCWDCVLVSFLAPAVHWEPPEAFLL